MEIFVLCETLLSISFFFILTLQLYLTQYSLLANSIIIEKFDWVGQPACGCVSISVCQIGIDHYWCLYSFKILLFVALKLMINICSATNLFLQAHYQPNIIFHHLSSYQGAAMSLWITSNGCECLYYITHACHLRMNATSDKWHILCHQYHLCCNWEHSCDI